MMPDVHGHHLVVARGKLYDHHGLGLGDSRVIHYDRGWSSGKDNRVTIASLELFSRGGDVYALPSRNRFFSPDEAVERAKLRMKEREYSLFENNCEHFVRWCIYGEARSLQTSAKWQGGARLARSREGSPLGDLDGVRIVHWQR